jgi:ribosomal protein S18 acetylase RimI-like enzyme
MSGGLEFAIAPARGDEDIAAAARLFREYQIALGVDLRFQGFEEELATLPGRYAPPRGEILIARAGRANAGIIAVRPFDGAPDTCEMKRLYVRPAFRSARLGRRLAEAVLDEARRIGYRRMLLDTLAEMGAAQALYRALGFTETDAYYDTPLPGTRYFERHL